MDEFINGKSKIHVLLQYLMANMQDIDNGLVKKVKIGVYAVILLIASFFILIIAKDILIPLSLGYLFASMIYPVVIFIHKRGIPRPLAIIISILLFIGVIFLIFNIYIQQLQSFIDSIWKYY